MSVFLQPRNITTPYYQYNTGLLKQTLEHASQSAAIHGYAIHYAMKANNNPAITGIIRDYGLGADCVSGNEVAEALRQGFPAREIVYAGVGKSDQEIELALRENILCLNCESLEELQVTEEIARGMQKIAPVAIRVNPGVAANTHRYITTGLEENKFGVHLSQLREVLDFASESPWLQLMGLHFHIGSQITTLEPFEMLTAKVNELWQTMNMDERGATLLNLGGGLGVDYENPEGNPIPPFAEYFNVFARNLQVPAHVKVRFELGRSIVAQCGKLITKVLYTKKGVNRSFVITDAGMNELMRPALYQSRHHITNLTSTKPNETYDVVGPVCESSDVFATQIQLPQTGRGDILAIHSCGAYSESMMLLYNMRDRAGVVL
ncbi:MAG: diaminopimelate decarboxylase, partial [Bacteroidetes bacterium]